VGGKKHFMYGLVDKTYIEESTTTSPLQSQDFVHPYVMDIRRVDGVERESLNAEQCQRECINTLSQRLCSLLSENLTEKVILNLTDCDSLSNHVTAKTTDEKVISLTKSNTLSNQHDSGRC
jgi:aminopeptidase C